MTIDAGPLIVIDVVTDARSMSRNRSSMSARVSIATPALADLTERPRMVTSRGPSTSACRTRSTTRVPPARSNSLNRALVSSAVPKPANMRIVHSCDRYIGGVDDHGCTDTAPATDRRRRPASTGTPDIVSNSRRRARDLSVIGTQSVCQILGYPTIGSAIVVAIGTLPAGSLPPCPYRSTLSTRRDASGRATDGALSKP